MASEELELRPQITEAETEEKSSAQFDVDQVFDGMNDYLKSVLAKLTSIPISSEAQPNGQSTLKVPSVKFQSSAIVSTISTTTSVTTPVSVIADSMNESCAVRSALGWYVNVPANHRSSKQVHCQTQGLNRSTDDEVN